MRQIARLAALAVAVGSASCATTTFNSTWKEPTAQPLDTSKKIATVMMTSRESLRRSAEAAMQREVEARGGQAVASYSLLPGEAAGDTARAKQILAEAGVDAIWVMRIVDKETSTSYVAGTPYYSPYGYWGYGWGSAYSPGYMVTDQIFVVETLVYSISQNKLVWAGQSETTNPEDIDTFVQELADAVGSELRSAGLIRSSK